MYILLVQSLCAVLSKAPNSKLMDRVEILEKAILKKNLYLNCTLEVRIEYLELCKEILDYEFSRSICELVKQFCFWFGQCNHIFWF